MHHNLCKLQSIATQCDWTHLSSLTVIVFVITLLQTQTINFPFNSLIHIFNGVCFDISWRYLLILLLLKQCRFTGSNPVYTVFVRFACGTILTTNRTENRSGSRFDRPVRSGFDNLDIWCPSSRYQWILTHIYIYIAKSTVELKDTR
jgi:hypothetical protein